GNGNKRSKKEEDNSDDGDADNKDSVDNDADVTWRRQAKKAARAHRRYGLEDEEHHHNATFEHSLTEKLLDAVLSDKIGHKDEHGHEVNLADPRQCFQVSKKSLDS
uniref:Uncharacterized protein n=1 Tax=Clytia hemisphaerica TaxID=252671 RepID=A0A7M5WW68_9CNID